MCSSTESTRRDNNVLTSGQINALTPDDIETIYSGRPGCGCGCNGNYTKPGDPSFKGMLTRTKKVFVERLDEVGVQDGINQVILYIEDDTRYRWIHLKPGLFADVPKRDTRVPLQR